MRYKLAIIASVLILSGCVGVNHTSVNSHHETLAPVPADSVQLFYDHSFQELPSHERIALVYAKPKKLLNHMVVGDRAGRILNYGLSEESNLVRKMRARAGELGADGLIIFGDAQDKRGLLRGNEILASGKVNGLAIRLTD